MSSKLYTRSWIAPEIYWQHLNDICVIETTGNDVSLLEFIATGHIQVARLQCVQADIIARIHESSSPLRSQLIKLNCTKAKLAADAIEPLTYHFHGALYLPDSSTFAILASILPPTRKELAWHSAQSQQAVAELWNEYKNQLCNYRRRTEQSRDDHDSFSRNLTCDEKTRDLLLTMNGYGDTNNYPPNPPSLDDLHSLLANGVLVPLKVKRGGVNQNTVLKSLEKSCLEPPRDGKHEAVLCRQDKTLFAALVTWQPRTSSASYPEIRCTVQKLLPRAITCPRREDVCSPVFDYREINEIKHVEGLDQIVENTIEQSTEIWLQFNDIAERAGTARNSLKEHGFEAFGWYQPYHVWSETMWGIYIPAEKIDNLACALHEDLRAVGEHSHALAMILALQLVYQHEFFHARVEACLSWLELTNLSPRHLRYQHNVYQTARMTDYWLEEALANWTSFAWLGKELPRLVRMGLARKQETVERVVKANLDMSPPGYNQWKRGEKQEAWRMFASELVSGKLAKSITNKILPLESMLADQLPFDMKTDDIPVRIIGGGVLVDSLLSSPANFAVPARREIERALKYFGYCIDRGRGKGSHELWTGSDNRSFPVPIRDPLSRGVFNSFLHHFDLDKSTYVLDIRPLL